MKKIIYVALIGLLYACASEEQRPKITQSNDYAQYLSQSTGDTYKNAVSEQKFWSNKLTADTSGVGSLSSLAGAYTRLFEATGDANHLYAAEKLFKKGMANSAHNKDAFARGLARNYISQHRFKEAKQVLEASYAGVSNKKATELMLFDVYMELGSYDEAWNILEKSKNMSDYNYLIRLAKWNDYKGDLDAAIRFIEKARDIADARKSKPLQLWTYTNLGDYYGHAGRIKDAYQQYLKALNLQPDNAYALKGIAWIAYSAEHDTEMALNILDSISTNHKVPDYYLLQAEIAEFNEDEKGSDVHTTQFLNAVEQGNYGEMYNAYLIEVYADRDPKKALALAEREVMNRPTPEAYHLLALAQLKNNNKKEALQTIERHVKNKTSEPMALYHTALVYEENDMDKEVAAIRAELLEAEFEVGPVLFEKIEEL